MTGQAMTRRTLITAVLSTALLTPALAACAPAPSAALERPDPLVALATAARADAALAAAVIAAVPKLAARVAPLRDARTEHAVALEAEVARQAGTTAGATGSGTESARPTSADAVAPGAASLNGLRKSVGVSGSAAGEVARTVDVRRVGLVASIAACCTSYAAALG